MTLYWMPNCSTCQKADAYLRENDRGITTFRDIKAEPLSRDEVEQLANAVGGVDELFSRRAKKYRSMGLHERELSHDEMLDLMAGEYTFIKRPVLVQGERAVAGFSPGTYDQFLGKR
jgi:arsenate reductase (glutaredoxin)